MSYWRPIGIHDTATKIEWKDTLLTHCDPYLVWSDLNASSSDKSTSRISLLVELAEDFDWEHEDTLSVTQLPWLANRQPDRSAIVPCVVEDIDGLVRVISRVGRDVRRFTLCRPRTEIGWRSISAQLACVIDVLNKRLEHPLSGPPPVSPVGVVVVAVIDDGCAFLNERLRRPSAAGTPPRQISLLDQDRKTVKAGDPYWTQPLLQPVLYLPLPAPAPPVIIELDWEGSHLERFAIQKLRGAVVRRNEIDGYRAAGYLGPLAVWTHGQVVLDLAVGWPDPLVPPGQAPVGPATDFIFVQLPRATIADTSGGSLDSHALDAMFYAALQAGATAWHAPVVANLSYGVYGKPHDGTSLFERATVALLNSPVAQTMELVLPAGNSHLDCTHAGGMLPANRVQPRTLYWHVPADCSCESTLQVWLPLGNKIEVMITAPDGSGPFLLTPQQAQIWKIGGELRCAAVHAPSVADSLSLTMVFIGVSPTRRTANPAASAITILGGNTAPSVGWAPPGVWTIELVNPAAQAVRFDARIERGGAAPALGDREKDSGRRQSYFVEIPRDAETPCGTLNGIATALHSRIHVVGAMQAQDEQLSPYSAAGPVYQPTHPPTVQPRGPTQVTVGDRSLHMPGVRVAGCRTRAIAEVDGTSMAAAVFTRLRVRQLATGIVPSAATQPLKARVFVSPEESLEAPANLRGGNLRVKA
jgi:hypothetical protein